jgi:hypothetical protein
MRNAVLYEKRIAGMRIGLTAYCQLTDLEIRSHWEIRFRTNRPFIKITIDDLEMEQARCAEAFNLS